MTNETGNTFMICKKLRYVFRTLALAVLVAYGAAAGLTASPVLDTSPAVAQAQDKPTGGMVPGGAKSVQSASDRIWAPIRRGMPGTLSLPDQMAATLVQSEGDNWRAFKNGPLSQFGGWLLLAAIVVLAAFRLIRGQIKIEHGPAGRTIERFNAVERATHWVTATSFIVLALTGLNVLYGRYVLKPILGADAFAALTYYGKIAHNYIAFAFMAGIIVMFVLWVRHNLFDKTDLTWIAQGGGLLSKTKHPPAKKFNFGQKCIFWIVILGGFTLSLSGLALLFPFEINIWAPTFKALNVVGFSLPTQLTPLMETQLSVLWHSLAALVMIAVILAHIYIGTPLGMEGAIGAVGQGQVDVNWAKEHHSLWVAEVTGQSSGGTAQPAE
jgi:formate dehydrogenase subunit gamma